MYSLDINFLNDRKIVVDTGGRKPAPVPVNQRMLMYAGVAVGLILPAAVAGFWLFQQSETTNLGTKLDNLKAQNATANAKLQQVAAIQKEADAINQETSGLATVFDQLKPWSALLQDVRDRLPAGVQLTCIAQVPATTTSITSCQGLQPSSTASTSGTPLSPGAPNTDIIVISGRTYSFDSINNFLLTLQNSTFFNRDSTQLITAELKDFPTQVEQPDSANSAGAPAKFKKAVEFTVQTNLSQIPASKSLPELERKGALGLVTRIEHLQQKGVLP